MKFIAKHPSYGLHGKLWGVGDIVEISESEMDLPELIHFEPLEPPKFIDLTIKPDDGGKDE